MQTRSKDVTIGEHKFSVRRLPTEVGSFIFMRMMGVSIRSTMAAAEEAAAKPASSSLPAEPPPEPAKKPSGEDQVRAISFSVFSGAIGFDDFKFIQTSCLKVIGLYDERDFPMPIMNDAGVWTVQGESINEDLGLVMQLVQEVLILCFASFFNERGLGT